MIRNRKYCHTDICTFLKDPNILISNFLNENVDVFDRNQNNFLFSFTFSGVNSRFSEEEKRIKLILRYGTPSYRTRMFPQNHHYNFRPGDFFAMTHYTDPKRLYEASTRHGNMFMVFNHDDYFQVESHYRIKEGLNQKDPLRALFHIDESLTDKKTRENFLDYLYAT